LQIAPIPLPLSKDDHYRIHPDKIAEEIARGTQVLLTSNPRNPTGHFVAQKELAEIQDLCRDRATLILDEFYGGYNYTTDCDGSTISGAANVIDVDKDGIVPHQLSSNVILSQSCTAKLINPHRRPPN
jgi:aspartate/methionine/tyrosine aminotransferase